MIRLKNVNKTFDGIKVLHDVSFTVEDGEAVQLTGVSGSGKTTLFNIILGLKKADSGFVSAPKHTVAVFQEDRLLEHLSAVENVALVSDETAARACLKELGLTDLDIAKPVRDLSGGQRRRVALARAFAAESGAVLLDEPFTGLDDEARAKAKEFIFAHQKNRSLLVISHEMRMQLREIPLKHSIDV